MNEYRVVANADGSCEIVDGNCGPKLWTVEGSTSVLTTPPARVYIWYLFRVRGGGTPIGCLYRVETVRSLWPFKIFRTEETNS